jgi:hypothetical protein
MHSVAPRHILWKKSSYSAANGNCVEIARLSGGHIAVRDSKNVTMPALGFTPAGWQAFITEIKTDRCAWEPTES